MGGSPAWSWLTGFWGTSRGLPLPPGTSSCLCLHLDLAPATPVWCQGTPLDLVLFSCSASVWAQLLTAAGAARASPCWGGRQAQAGDSWGQRTSMAFRCLDGPPPLAGRVGAANVLTRLTGHCHSAASVPGLLTSGQGWPCIAEDCGELPGTEASCAVLILSYVDWTFYMLDKRSSREPHPKPLWYLVFLLSFRFFFSVLCA